ncbi:MAG: arylsulfatase [Bacteroidota bacterium]
MNAPLFTGLLIALGSLFSCQPAPEPVPERPNVLLIMVDDMGWSDLGCYGGEVQTPHLNRLAKEGMRFRQFYNNAKCTTTRFSLISGLYPRRDSSDSHMLRTNMMTLGEIMKLGGYQTSLSGKWHLGRDQVRHPFHRGFDRYYGLLDGCSNFFDPSQQDPPYKGNRIRYFGENDTRITEFPDDFYATDAFTDHAIQAIEDYSQNEAPFFLHLCYTAPHYPIQALPEDIEKYIGTFDIGWEEMRKERYQRQVDMGLIDAERYPLSGFDSRAYPWEEANHEFEDLRMAVYAAMIDRVDQNIGRLLSTLEEQGELDNTLILFLSDNGGCAEEPGGRDPAQRTPGPKEDYVAVGPAWGWAQNAPFRRYKVWMNEGGINTPMIAWWPGQVPADTITDEVAHIMDVLPTFGELAEVAYPTAYQGQAILPVDGTSMLSVLKGNSRVQPNQLCWEYAKNRAIRQGDWKLVWDKLNQQWELYDLSQDRTETQNLADQFPDRVENMAADWFVWADKHGLEVRP